MAATYIAPVSWGMGDLAVSLPAVQWLVQNNHQTYLVLRSSLQAGVADRLEGLAGVVSEKDFDPARIDSADKYINLRDHPIQKNYWWGSPEFSAAYPDYTINDCLKKITSDFGLPVNFDKLIPLRSNDRAESKGKVIFIAGSDGSYKCWPRALWLGLEKLLNSAGKSAVLLGDPEQSEAVQQLRDDGLDWIATPDLGDAIDLISSAESVVGVDTGLTHIAVNQGVNTVTLFRSDPFYIRRYENVHSLIAKPCPAECAEKSASCTYNEITDFVQWQPRTWHCSIDDTSRCMSSIKPEAVFDTLRLSLSPKEEVGL